ncbi:hypothetical protein NW764_004350 [Fusarium oxysporum]|nr:hypothetical protein NW764_004350 [Fusarium oxysporum]
MNQAYMLIENAVVVAEPEKRLRDVKKSIRKRVIYILRCGYEKASEMLSVDDERYYGGTSS